ncbi:MAG TPA: zf-HC2 domain-containing protein [Candidatus Acidoferrales bacterium]|nr:zf-HC2 domain-containing protein [Candidatus Acidoferrales bacterium]
MNCERMESQLIAYLDGRASVSERREVDQHLAACAACRARVEGFRGVWKMLDETPAPEPSAWFDARLRQRIAAEPPPGIWMRFAAWFPQPRLALATLALVLVGIWAATATGPLRHAHSATSPVAMSEEQNFRMIKNMQVLENYDVLKDLSALNEPQGD